MEKIYWTFFQDGQVRFLLAATARGLCFTGALNKELDELVTWAQKKYKQVELIEDASRLQPYYDEFSRFMRGECRDLACPLDVKGTAFQQQVWDALRDIPYGEVVSYQWIANGIGRPTAVRAVGGAIGANPVMIVIPCHRVIGKNGALTGFRGGIPMKELLLALEKGKAAL
ncbi:MAG: methylated-DNA--[protein]-cysteine S-methyltransferase [Solibacillus sp.]